MAKPKSLEVNDLLRRVSGAALTACDLRWRLRRPSCPNLFWQTSQLNCLSGLCCCSVWICSVLGDLKVRSHWVQGSREWSTRASPSTPSTTPCRGEGRRGVTSTPSTTPCRGEGRRGVYRAVHTLRHAPRTGRGGRGVYTACPTPPPRPADGEGRERCHVHTVHHALRMGREKRCDVYTLHHTLQMGRGGRGVYRARPPPPPHLQV